MLITINQKLFSQPIAGAIAKFLSIKGNTHALNIAYNQLQELTWEALLQNPNDKDLYQLLMNLENEYYWKPESKVQTEANKHHEFQIRKIWEFSLKHNPDWAESRYYLTQVVTIERFV